MSKFALQVLQVQEGQLMECQFINFFYRDGKKQIASFKLTFRVASITGVDAQTVVSVSNAQLGMCFIEKLLVPYILPLHSDDVFYNRINFRLIGEASNVQTAKYEIGRLAGLQKTLDPDAITGTYSCVFVKKDSRRQLSLRIRHVNSRIKRDYFINSVLQNSISTNISIEEGSSEVNATLQFRVCGLTANRVFDEMYDFFDEIIEAIN